MAEELEPEGARQAAGGGQNGGGDAGDRAGDRAGGHGRTPPAARQPDDQYAAFRHSSYTRYWLARFLGAFSTQMIAVAVGWQLYDLTGNPLDLGYVGLTQFLPALLLVLVTGSAADRFGRRKIMAICLLAEAICAAGLFALVFSGSPSIWPIFVLLTLAGTAAAFFSPASNALVANLVPAPVFANAVAWNSFSWQTATIVGPVAGGLLYGIGAAIPFAAALALLLVAAISIASIPKPAQTSESEPVDIRTILAGFSYVWREKVVLGALSLDLFVVMMAGAFALLPVYARDILEVGPIGLGLLRAAPGIGAVVTALWLARYPIRDHVGVVMFICVFIFGMLTVIFGLSGVGWLSIVALGLLGAFDMASVYIRQTLVQLWTPDRLRGRVNAVNAVFLGGSNELGDFRAGISAALFGAVPAVVGGGVIAIAITGLWAFLFPELRKVRYLTGRRDPEGEVPPAMHGAKPPE